MCVEKLKNKRLK